MSLSDVAVSLFRLLPPEAAHRLTLRALRLLPGGRPAAEDPRLAVDLWGLRFPNPIGLAAGFDKDAEAPGALLGLGFGFVEAGTVTPLAQRGNPRPRLFRLAADRAVINRMGFNNRGLDAFEARLSAFRARGGTGIVGANVGRNRDSASAEADYAAGAARLAPLADYLVANVSSPNTPGLRALQGKTELTGLVDAIRAALPAGAPPLLLKIAPDLGDADLADIAAVALDRAVDGLILTNTTIARPEGLRGAAKGEAGGLSGRPLFAPSTAVLRRLFRATEGRVPLIGVGGIGSAADAYAKIRAGASLVQLYTALVYEGPGLVGRIRRELPVLLERDGFASIGDAVGADHR